MAFGDFRRGYLIVDRVGIRVLRDPYSSKPYVLFYTTKRVGGGVQDFDAIKLLKFARNRNRRRAAVNRRTSAGRAWAWANSPSLPGVTAAPDCRTAVLAAPRRVPLPPARADGRGLPAFLPGGRVRTSFKSNEREHAWPSSSRAGPPSSR